MPSPNRLYSATKDCPRNRPRPQHKPNGRARPSAKPGGKTLAPTSGKSRQGPDNRHPRNSPSSDSRDWSAAAQRPQSQPDGRPRPQLKRGGKSLATKTQKSRQVAIRRNPPTRRPRPPVEPRFRPIMVATETFSLYVSQDSYRRMSDLASAHQLSISRWVRRTVEGSLDRLETARDLPALDLADPPVAVQVDRYPKEDMPPDRRIDCRLTLDTKLRLQRLAAHDRRPLSAWLRHQLDASLSEFERAARRAPQ